jgi:hypothetical protein
MWFELAAEQVGDIAKENRDELATGINRTPLKTSDLSVEFAGSDRLIPVCSPFDSGMSHSQSLLGSPSRFLEVSSH